MAATSTTAAADLPEETILRAAAHLFRERGLAGTSIRAIAEAAGVFPGSLTYRFRTKEDLVVALSERAVAYAIDEVRREIAASDDPLERIRLGMRTHLRLLLSEDDAVYVLVFDWHRFPERTRARLLQTRRRYDALWEGLCYAAAGSGQLASGLDMGLVKRFWFGAMNSVALWYDPHGAMSPDQIADAFSTLLAVGTLAPNARPQSLDELYAEMGIARAPSSSVMSEG